MTKVRLTLNIFAALVFTLLVSSAAQAQATRTWVSGVGDDVNPCSRTAPCKTFAGAISKTASGGEIDALDPGGFGAVTLTKSILIDGTTGAGFGSILASGVNGVNVNDSASGSPNTIVVRLRNLSINGAGTTLGVNGVNFTSGATVHVENCTIRNFSGAGILLNSGTASRLIVENTTVTEVGNGISVSGTPATPHAVVVDNSSFTRNTNGISVSGRANMAVSNSVISLNNANVSAAGVIVSTAAGGATVIDLENCQVNYNSVGVQPNAQSAIRLSNVHMTGNANALNFNGGTIATYNNNRIFGNTAGENFPALTDVLQQ
ncbi:MAG: right-handed parallel beta-helix repeat-containing protein [Acidobacteria bacterium]|nr:right-handed parallel beta-helix repeat-containing protein [Acidobacteriota bacterium]